MARSARHRVGHAACVARCDRDRPSALDQLHDAGYREVITSALAPGASLPLVDSGLRDPGPLASPCLTISSRYRHPASQSACPQCPTETLLRVDAAAFDEFWRLDARSGSTKPRARRSLRVTRGDPLVGYALFGRADDVGYVQRLAIDPARGGGARTHAPRRRPALAPSTTPARVRQYPGRQRPRSGSDARGFGGCPSGCACSAAACERDRCVTAISRRATAPALVLLLAGITLVLVRPARPRPQRRPRRRPRRRRPRPQARPRKAPG